MPDSRGIIVYGSSIFLSGIASALSEVGVTLTQVKSDDPHPEQILVALNPRVILFDVTCEPPGWFAELQNNPMPSLIGINPNSDNARVVSIFQPLLSDIQALADLILREHEKASQTSNRDATVPLSGTSDIYCQ